MTDEEAAAEWAESVPQRLRDDESLALRVERSGYVAFVTYEGGNQFVVRDRHYHGDDWLEKPIGRGELVEVAARFASQAELVERPDLESVEVSLDGV